MCIDILALYEKEDLELDTFVFLILKNNGYFRPYRDWKSRDSFFQPGKFTFLRVRVRKVNFPQLEKTIPYFSNPYIEECRFVS
jgi:hypothetical protein